MEQQRQNTAMINTTVLAYLGDAVYEVYVRKYVMDTGQVHADRLHQSAVAYVRAEGQAKAIKALIDSLPEEQQSLVKRARNRKITSKPKNVDPVTYKWATAFEALVGYLYLEEKEEELEALLQKTVQTIREGTIYG